MWTLMAFALGLLLDMVFGDPHSSPFRHPVVVIGKWISALENRLRRAFRPTPKGELWAGALLAALVPAVCFAAVFLALFGLYRIHPLAGFLMESFWCYQILAVKSLKDESMKVYHRLKAGDVSGARHAVSMIVGRDTEELDEAGIAKAAVETVAENNSDGAVAPMVFLALGGAPLGMLYKAVNTLDSMVGYKNPRYLYFGRASAYLDDALNFLPARLAGALMAACAGACGLDAKGAWRTFREDRKRHASPNSAHTEAACAGALGVMLGGDARYHGKMVSKPTIGRPLRPIDREDIRRANRLHVCTSAAAFVILWGIRALLLWR